MKIEVRTLNELIKVENVGSTTNMQTNAGAEFFVAVDDDGDRLLVVPVRHIEYILYSYEDDV